MTLLKAFMIATNKNFVANIFTNFRLSTSKILNSFSTATFLLRENYAAILTVIMMTFFLTIMLLTIKKSIALIMTRSFYCI